MSHSIIRPTASPCDYCDDPTANILETDNDGKVCTSCSRHWYSCDECSRVFRYWTDLKYVEGVGRLCERCVSKADYTTCVCETYISQGDTCQDCLAAERDTYPLHYYNYTPDEFIFHGDGPVFLGLELEIEAPDGIAACAEVAEYHLEDLGYLKEDESLTRGFEIVTHPMSHRWAKANFPWAMLPDLEHAGASTNNYTGLHVHISRDGFDGPAHVYRWLKFIYRNEERVTRFARRSSKDYAPFQPGGRLDAKNHAKGEVNKFTSRHAAVNVTKPGTYELRVPKSTLDECELLATLDFADGSVEYTRTLTVADIVRRGGWEWDSFTRWAGEREEYRAFTELDTCQAT